MPPIISISIQKGGVSKTTLAVNIPPMVLFIWSLINDTEKKALLVDFDPQASSTSWHFDEALKPSLTSAALFDDQDTWNILENAPHLIYPTRIKGLDIVPACIALSRAESRDYAEPTRRLKMFLEATAQHYDLIVIDTPPNLGKLTVNALMAATHVLVPVVPERASLEAMPDFSHVVGSVSKVNKGLTFLGLVLTQIDERTKVHQHYRDSFISGFGDRVLGMLHRATLYPEMAHKKKFLHETDKTGRPYEEMRDITKLIMKKVGLDAEKD